jgi:hypothetical protein
MLSALWIERLLFSANGGGHALAEVPRLVQQVIKVPQSFAEYRRLDRIHGDRELLSAIGTPERVGASVKSSSTGTGLMRLHIMPVYFGGGLICRYGPLRACRKPARSASSLVTK